MCKALVACEESQIVTIHLRNIGIEAFSCDIKNCSGNHPEWHYKCDIKEIVHDKWDLIIAFPPCTHLAISGAKWFDEKIKDGRQLEAIQFFKLFTDLKCKKVAIENPVGIMSSFYRPPDQVTHPYFFGDPFKKTTCFWLKGLPKLRPTKIVDAGENVTYGNKSLPAWYSNMSKKDRDVIRSKTFPGMAKAMADQWGKFVKRSKNKSDIGGFLKKLRTCNTE